MESGQPFQARRHHRTRAGQGHADGPPAETGRKDWAAPELV